MTNLLEQLISVKPLLSLRDASYIASYIANDIAIDMIVIHLLAFRTALQCLVSENRRLMSRPQVFSQKTPETRFVLFV